MPVSTTRRVLQAVRRAARHTVAHAWADAFGEQLEIDDE
jgi:hypothetical protein